MLAFNKCSTRGTFLALASLLIVFGFAIPKAEAATQGSWSFNANGTGVVFQNVGSLLTVGSTYVNYGGGPESKVSSFVNGTLNSNLSSVGVFSNSSIGSNIYTYLGLDASDPVGNYYVLVNGLGNGYTSFNVFYKLYWDGVKGIPETVATSSAVYGSGYSNRYNTRFISGVLSGNDTNLSLTTTYFHDTSEFDNNNRPDTILFTAVKEGTLLSNDSQYINGMRFILPLVQATTTKTLSYGSVDFLDTLPKLPAGSYTGYVNFWNALNQYFVFERTSIVIRFTISNTGVLTVSNTVITNGLSDVDVTKQDCSFSNFSACITEPFLYLFIPPQSSFNYFNDTLSTIPTRFPFSYFYSVTSVVYGLSAVSSSTPQASLDLDFTGSTVDAVIPILSSDTVDYYLTTQNRTLFRDLMSYTLWILFAVMIFFQVRSLFNRQ